MGLGPSRTTCQGYSTQMLLIRKTYFESYGPALARKTDEEAFVDQSDVWALNNAETILNFFRKNKRFGRMNMMNSRSVVRYSSGQDQGPSLKTMMGTLLFRNVVTPACRQILELSFFRNYC